MDLLLSSHCVSREKGIGAEWKSNTDGYRSVTNLSVHEIWVSSNITQVTSADNEEGRNSLEPAKIVNQVFISRFYLQLLSPG